MMNHFPCAAVCILALVASPVVAAAGEVIHDAWCVARLAGRRVGYQHVTMTRLPGGEGMIRTVQCFQVAPDQGRKGDDGQ